MNNRPRRVLRRLIQQYGKELITDPRRTEAFLNDLCGQYRREIFVLVNAQKQRIPTELDSAPRWMPRSALWSKLAQRLQDNLAMTPEAAAWAVESWAIALDLAQPASSPLWRWLTGTPKNKAAVAQGSSAHHQTAPQEIQAETQDPTTIRQITEVDVQYRKNQQRSSRSPQIPKRRPIRVGFPPRRKKRSWRLLRAQPISAAMTWAVILLASTAALWMLIYGLENSGLFYQPALARFSTWNRSSPAQQLASAYPPVQTALVVADILNVRDAPSLTAPKIGELKLGTAAQVDEYSEDGRWSHISAPVAGWVHNRFLNFVYGDRLQGKEVTHHVTLAYTRYIHTSAESTVYAGPGDSYPRSGTLRGGDPVTAIAISATGDWVQIVEPIPGWVAAKSLQMPTASE